MPKKTWITTVLDDEILSYLKGIERETGFPVNSQIEMMLKEYYILKLDDIKKISKTLDSEDLISEMESVREEVGIPVSSQMEMMLKGYYIKKVMDFKELYYAK